MAVENFKKNIGLVSGYTLIELLTVIAITAVLSLVSVQILLQGQLRSSQAEAISLIRQEGQFVLDQITYELRSSLDATCYPEENRLEVQTANGSIINYALTGSSIASDSVSLTTSDVEIQDFNPSCSASGDTAGVLVKLDFDMTTPEILSSIDNFSQNFSTSVYIRSID